MKVFCEACSEEAVTVLEVERAFARWTFCVDCFEELRHDEPVMNAWSMMHEASARQQAFVNAGDVDGAAGAAVAVIEHSIHFADTLNSSLYGADDDRKGFMELVQEHVQLRPSGKRLIGLCPFHEEKTPSFTVDPKALRFHCIGCGEKGDARDFRIAKLEAGK